MASKVRRGWSAGRSLEEALQDSHLEWRSPAIKISQGSATPAEDRKNRALDDALETPTKQPRSASMKTVGLIKGRGFRV